jgi:hypothetical protein
MRNMGQGYNSTTKVARYLLKDCINQESEGEFKYTANDPNDQIIEECFHKQNVQNPRYTQEHKDSLHEAIHRSFISVDENDDEANEIYDIVNAERDKIRGVSIDDKNHFALRALTKITRNERADLANLIVTESYYSHMRVALNTLLSKMMDKYQKPIILIKKSTVISKIACKSCAIYGAYFVTEQGFKLFWTYFFQSPLDITQLTQATTGTVFTFYTLNQLFHIARTVEEFNTPKESVTTVPNISLASVCAVIPSICWTLMAVDLGFQNLDESCSSQKWKAFMVPYAIDTALSLHTHMKNKLQDFLTASVTTIPECIKESAVKCTPTCLTKGIKRATPQCLKRCMSSSYNFLSGCIPGFIKESCGLCYKRCWLNKWHVELDEAVEYEFDSVTLASLDFTIKEIDEDEESSTLGRNMQYHDVYEDLSESTPR